MPPQVSQSETSIILELAEQSLAAPGELVEFGCYRGDTSLLLERLIERAAVNKRLWLYDSFEGLPAKTAEDASVAGEAFKAGELLVSKREVVERFKKAGLRVPKIRKGFFENLDPATDVPEQICFAFLDGDLYRSIRVSFALIEGRIAEGGIIVVHDYNNPELPGVTQAVDEWLSGHKKAKLTVRASLAILEP